MRIPQQYQNKIRAMLLYWGYAAGVVIAGSLFWYEPLGWLLLYLVAMNIIGLIQTYKIYG